MHQQDGAKHSYVYASGKLLRETYGDTIIDFFYSTSGQPYALNYNGTVYYYITNLQGDVMSIVNASGTVVVSYKYDPYGNILSITGTLADTLGQINPLRYRGYVYDQDTGFYYLQSRYYDPSIGRFLNADAFVSTGQGVLGYNMFAYCLNNPVNYSDKSGRTADDWAGWVGEQLGELIYEWITGDDHPSHHTREVERQIRQKQNESFVKGIQKCWDAYVHSIELEAEAQYRQDMAVKGFVEDRFSTPEKARNTLNGIGYAFEGVGIYVGTKNPVAGGIVTAIGLAFNVLAWVIDVANEETRSSI